ncbi:SPASM domain-containing protein [Helicobacter sp. 16-1353]|uniref:radical SAM/SPASM domain-containing protein n=1 Tax=Helicobacter sp. 16-1353 TaxID=2004996 RepID=UPI0015EF07F1|nr:SPASM domain-containing protein [Helicobacter sp. 16-1353]
MKFQKIYIEISDICGLDCSFCPSMKNTRGKMPLWLFQKALKDCSSYTKLIALHILGDPLKMPNIREYLAIATNYNLNVEITTSGVYLNEFEFLLKSPIRQVNISLDAVMEIKSSHLRKQIFRKIFDFCRTRMESQSEVFINLRIQKRAQNKELLNILQEEFKMPISLDSNTRIGKKTIIVVREPFLWNLESAKSHHIKHTKGFCYALQTHFGILANGDVVPCCIDVGGNIILGNIAKDSIATIFNSNRTKSMIKGFKSGIIVESFCIDCSFRKQFDWFIV